MASKPGSVEAVDGDIFRFVLNVLEHSSPLTTNWAEVAKKNGIAYPKNASQKFRELVKKHGYKYDAGNITVADENNGRLPATPKTPKTKRPKVEHGATPASTPASKKRKIAQDIEVKAEVEGSQDDVKDEGGSDDGETDEQVAT